MRPSLLIPLVVGLGAGVFAVYSLLGAMQKAKGPQKAVEKVSLVVAKAEIPYATRITDEMLQTVEVVKPCPLKGVMGKTENVVGRVSGARILQGVPVFKTMLAPEGTAEGAIHQIPADMRQVPLRVQSFTVEGLEPGDYVDVLYSPPGQQKMNEPTKPLAERVEVFSVGGRVKGQVDKADAKGTRTRAPVRSGQVTVVLLLPTEKAFAFRKLKGAIELALRPFDAGGEVATISQDRWQMLLDELIDKPEETPEPQMQLPIDLPEPEPVPPPPPKTRVIPVYQQGKKIDEGEFEVQEGAPKAAPPNHR